MPKGSLYPPSQKTTAVKPWMNASPFLLRRISLRRRRRRYRGCKPTELHIGTSGWVYPHWEKVFYPGDLSPKDKLKYFSQHFKTVEINYSFYHLPWPTTYQNWYNQVPEDFVFAVKASRFITHIKRLVKVKDAWKIFLESALNLKEKLGPILFQFPASFQANTDNIKRLKEFLKVISKDKNLRLAFEFRHQSWCETEIYNLLKEHNAAWVIADSPNYPKAMAITANFVYLRMHGSKILFGSKYTDKELKDLAQMIKKWLKNRKEVFVYFNNDAYGYAVENARTLASFCFSC